MFRLLMTEARKNIRQFHSVTVYKEMRDMQISDLITVACAQQMFYSWNIDRIIITKNHQLYNYIFRYIQAEVQPEHMTHGNEDRLR